MNLRLLLNGDGISQDEIANRGTDEQIFQCFSIYRLMLVGYSTTVILRLIDTKRLIHILVPKSL